MRQAIHTKWYGPTNQKSSRIKASANAGYIWHPWDYALDGDDNHLCAAQKLQRKLGWTGNLVGGSLSDGSCVFIIMEK